MRDQFSPQERAEWKPKIIARNTFRYFRDGETIIRLHRTDIVRKLPDGSVILNSGGWRTPTTKERMSSYGWRVIQDKGQWYVSKNGSWDGERVPYFDGIQVPQCFDHPPAEAAKNEQREKKLRKQVKRMLAELDKLEVLPEPGPGDCWLCMMHRPKGPEPSKDGYLPFASGDGPEDGTDHILSHVEECYIHGTLLVNALTWAGYSDPAFIWHMDNRERASFKRGTTRRRPGWIRRPLRRYLYRKLGLAA